MSSDPTYLGGGGGFVCDKIHVTAETVGNIIKRHFDVLIKKADGSEQNMEGRDGPSSQKLLPLYPCLSGLQKMTYGKVNVI